MGELMRTTDRRYIITIMDDKLQVMHRGEDEAIDWFVSFSPDVLVKRLEDSLALMDRTVRHELTPVEQEQLYELMRDRTPVGRLKQWLAEFVRVWIVERKQKMRMTPVLLVFFAARRLTARGRRRFTGFEIAYEDKSHRDKRFFMPHSALYRAIDALVKRGVLDAEWDEDGDVPRKYYWLASR